MNETTIKALFFITGTTRGIGNALLQEVLKRPASQVVTFSRNHPSAAGRHQNCFVDLRNPAQIASAFDSLAFDVQRFNELETTVLINNAGVLDPIAPIWNCQDRLIEDNVRVNLVAPLVLCRHFFGFCRSLPGEKWIVNVTSGASRHPYFGWSAYCAAKAGLDMATRTMAVEFSQIDPSFRVCAVAPGTVDTAMQRKIRKCAPSQFREVEKFIQLKNSGALFSPVWTAATLMRMLWEKRFENGGRYDLREMADRYA